MRFVSDDALDNDAADNLAKAIDVYYASSEINKPLTRQTDTQLATLGLRKLGTLYDVFSGGAQYQIVDTLTPAEATTDQTLVDIEDDATLVFKMQEEAGNIFQGKEIPAFDLQVIAMQNTVEADSFGTDYDAKANGLPDHPEWGNLNTTASAKAVDGADTVVTATGAVLTMPAGAVDAGTDVSLTVEPGIMNTGITVGDNNTAVTYDIKVTPETNTVLKKVELNIGSGKTGLVVYHNATAMTKLTAANTTAEGYFYDPSTGILTIWSKTFSPFTIITAKPAVVKAADAVAAINNAKSGDTVVLGEGAVELPATLPDNVLIKGSSAEDTKVDAGAWYGRTNAVNVNIENVTFTPATEGDGRILRMKGEGSFKNCVFDNDDNWSSVYELVQTGDMTFEGCKFEAKAYACNFSTTKDTLLFDNCDFTGWNSWGDGGQIVIKNSKFHRSSSYGVICSWTDITIENCELDAGVEIYSHKVPKVWRINNTTKNGVKITAENIKTLFDTTDTDVTDIWNLCECYVDGVRVPADQQVFIGGGEGAQGVPTENPPIPID